MNRAHTPAHLIASAPERVLPLPQIDTRINLLIKAFILPCVRLPFCVAIFLVYQPLQIPQAVATTHSHSFSREEHNTFEAHRNPRSC
ncbi:hypothetical protein CBS115989_10357 [Aspergillus niger]|nr:hypothetical protein CBS115989_10357 [Aspergillus niger]KAI2836290.1 hypothetical protein CBS11232_10224 [Aspergillus niger]KAI2869072.1 hypothetical protein CBS115988_10260 [Aspergillus niger]